MPEKTYPTSINTLPQIILSLAYFQDIRLIQEKECLGAFQKCLLNGQETLPAKPKCINGGIPSLITRKCKKAKDKLPPHVMKIASIMS